MTRVKRNKKPSRAVAMGATAGTLIGTLIDVGANVAGVPLPPGTGAALGGALAGLFTYLTRGGRRGEAD